MPIRKFIIKGRSPRYQLTKLPPQPIPKTTSSFDDLLKQSNLDKLRSTYGVDMPKSFYERPPVISLAKERIEKVGRKVTEFGLSRLPKIRQAAAKRLKARRIEYGTKKTQIFQRTNFGLKRTDFGKRVKAKIDKLQTQAIKLADIKGQKAMTKMEQKLSVNTTSVKDRPISAYVKKSDPAQATTRRETEYVDQITRDMGYEPRKTFNFKKETTLAQDIKSAKLTRNYKRASAEYRRKNKKPIDL